MENERYYVSSPSGGRGWVKCHVIVDRSTRPHTVPGVTVTGPYKMSSRTSAAKACAALNAAVGDDWVIEDAGTDSFARLYEWAAQSKAFTEAEYDPSAGPSTSFIREAA